MHTNSRHRQHMLDSVNMQLQDELEFLMTSVMIIWNNLKRYPYKIYYVQELKSASQNLAIRFLNENL